MLTGRPSSESISTKHRKTGSGPRMRTMSFHREQSARCGIGPCWDRHSRNTKKWSRVPRKIWCLRTVCQVGWHNYWHGECLNFGIYCKGRKETISSLAGRIILIQVWLYFAIGVWQGKRSTRTERYLLQSFRRDEVHEFVLNCSSMWIMEVKWYK